MRKNRGFQTYRCTFLDKLLENKNKISDNDYKAEEFFTNKDKITLRPIRKKSQNYAAINNPQKKVRPVKNKIYNKSVGNKTQNIKRGFAIYIIKININLILNILIIIYKTLNNLNKK